jgi:flagellar hook-length control protein FliK
MATIASVSPQDGQPSGSPATETAAGEGGAAFPALLSRQTGATAAATPQWLPAEPESAMVPDEEPAAALAADVLALVAADLRNGAVAVPAASAVPSPAGAVAIPPGRTAQVPGPLRALETLPYELLDDVPQPEPPVERSVTLPADVKSMALPMLAMLQAGARPPQSASGPLPSGGTAEALRAVSDPLAQAGVALAGLVSAEESGTSSERDAASGFAGANAQLAHAPVLRDGVPLSAHPRALAGALGTPAWQQSLGTEVRLLIERGASAATLRVSPEHLGPIEVRIDLADERASVWFTAAHPDTRAALADALPRLRDMLASIGVNLGETGVQREAPGDADRRDGSPPGRTSLPEASAESRVVLSRLDAGRGLVDEYA